MTIALSDITTDYIRGTLNNIGTNDLADEAIEEAIDDATSYVNKVKSSIASVEVTARTIIAFAKYNSYSAYCAKVVRSAGVVPAPAQIQLEEYKKRAEEWLKLAKAGVQVIAVPVAGQKSAYDYTPTIAGLIIYSAADSIGPDYVRQRAEEGTI